MLALFGRRRSLNKKAFAVFLAGVPLDSTDTPYEGIEQIPGGGCHSRSLNGTSSLHYKGPASIMPQRMSFELASDKLRSLLEAAVHRAIDRPDKTVLELSGGLDSSTLVAITIQQHPKLVEELHSTITLRFNGDQNTEDIRNLHTFRGRNNLLKNELWVSEHYTGSSWESLEQVYPYGPWIDPTVAIQAAEYEQLSASGRRCVITGIGGDATTGTRAVYSAMLRSLQLLKLVRSFARDPMPLSRLIHRYLFLPALPDWMFSLAQAENDEMLWPCWLNPEFVQSAGLLDSMLAREQEVTSTHNSYELAEYMHGGMDLSGAAQASLATSYGLELRHPFLDWPVLSHILSLDPEYRFRNGRDKAVLRSAAADLLPERLVNRRVKSTFTPIVANGLRALGVRLHNTLLDGVLVQRGFIDRAATSQMLDAFLAGSKNVWQAQARVEEVWTLVSGELWLRWFIYGGINGAFSGRRER